MQLLTLRYIGKFLGNGFTRFCDPVITMYCKCHGGQAFYVKLARDIFVAHMLNNVRSRIVYTKINSSEFVNFP